MASSGCHSLWRILLLWAAVASSEPVAPVCEPPPDPSVAFPMYNRLLTVRLPLKRDPDTARWAAAAFADGPAALASAGLHELRHLLGTVFPGKLWIHDADSAQLEANGTQLTLTGVVVELDSPANADHCSHVFQQHLYMASETHAADTRLDLRRFSDIQVDYQHLFGPCRLGRVELARVHAALRLDRAQPECRGISSAAAAPAGLAADLRALVDRLFFMPSRRFNVTSRTTGPLTLLMQSNARVLAFAIDYSLTVPEAGEYETAWGQLNKEVTRRYLRMTRRPDDYGVQRQGAAPGCLNYLNFASQPVVSLTTGCRACQDLVALVSVNVSLSESTEIRPPQCETIVALSGAPSGQDRRREIQVRDLLASLALDNATAHLFRPWTGSGDYFDVRSVSCSADPSRRLTALVSVRLRALHPALLRHPVVLRSALRRNLNSYLMARHLGLAALDLVGDVSASGVDCQTVQPQPQPQPQPQSVGNCTAVVLRHRFGLRLGRSTALLVSQLTPASGGSGSDALPGHVRFLHAAGLARAAGPAWSPELAVAAAADAGPASLTLRSVVQQVDYVLVDSEAAYALGPSGPDAPDAVKLAGAFAGVALPDLRADFGSLELVWSNLTVERANACLGQPATPKDLDAGHALRLRFRAPRELLYGGTVGDYLVAALINSGLRRAGLRDIQGVWIGGSDCGVGADTCQVTAHVLCNATHPSAPGGSAHPAPSALAAALTADPLLRPRDLSADVVDTPTSTTSVAYRFAVSPYFSRPPPLALPGAVTSSRVSIVWRLTAAGAPALAFRRLSPAADGQAKFLLEQLLTDLLGHRLVSWPSALAYKSDLSVGRLDASVAVDAAALAADPVLSAPAELAAFLGLSDLRWTPARPPSTGWDSAVLRQTYRLTHFVNDVILKATPDSNLTQLLEPKLRYVQSSVFSGTGGRPKLLDFDFRAAKLPASTGGPTIQVDAVSTVAWRSPDVPASGLDEAALSRLVTAQLDALQADVNVFPLTFDASSNSGWDTLRLLDWRRGADRACDLLIRVRPTPADVADAAAGAADATWLKASARLTAALAAARVNATHASVVTMPTRLDLPLLALTSIPLQPAVAGDSCAAAAARLLTAAAVTVGLLDARPVFFSAVAAPIATTVDKGAGIRHSALLPDQRFGASGSASASASAFADYFCFLLSWGHRLLLVGGDSVAATCGSANAEQLGVRLDPLSTSLTPSLRLSADYRPAPTVDPMPTFWLVKNFYLSPPSEIIWSLDSVRHPGGPDNSGIIVDQLPAAPPRPTASVDAATTVAAATTATTAAVTTAVTTSMPVTMATTKAPSGAATTTKQYLAPTTSSTSPTTASHQASTPVPTPPPTPPPGPYKTVHRLANLTLTFDLPASPWEARYFLENDTLAAASVQDVSAYIVGSALRQALARSAWQPQPDEIDVNRVFTDANSGQVLASAFLLLTDDRNLLELDSVVRAALDQSMLLSSVFPRRSFSAAVKPLLAPRYLRVRPVAPSTPTSAVVSVDHRLLVSLSPDAPDYLRHRQAPASVDDPLLEFFVAQLVTDAYKQLEGDSAAPPSRIRASLQDRPHLLRFKSDSQTVAIDLRCSLRLEAAATLPTPPQLAAAWQGLPHLGGLRRVLHLELDASNSALSKRGLLLYVSLRLESYVSKKSLLSLPQDYLAVLLKPKIEYVIQQVFNGVQGGTPSLDEVPRYLDVECGFTKRDAGLDILALTRVEIGKAFRVANLEQRLLHHVMERLEQLANDQKISPSVFSVGRTDLRVLDLKESLRESSWCDLLYSFGLPVGETLAASSTGHVELDSRLFEQLAAQLPRYIRLERFAILELDTAAGGEIRALVTLSSPASLPFEEAAKQLLTAAASPALRLRTRAIAAPFRARPPAAASAAPPAPGLGRTRRLAQTFTFLLNTDPADPTAAALTDLAKEKLLAYACHLYQGAIESAHWSPLHLAPHTCGPDQGAAASSVAAFRLAVGRSPLLTLPAVQVNISALVFAQQVSTEFAGFADVPGSIAADSDRALRAAMTVKNFYLNSPAELILTDASASAPYQPWPGIWDQFAQLAEIRFRPDNASLDYLLERDSPTTLTLARYLLVDALTAAGSGDIAAGLAALNASLGDNGTDVDSATVLVGFSAVSASGGRRPLRDVLTEAIAGSPLAAAFFTRLPSVEAWTPTATENGTTLTPTPAPSKPKQRSRRSTSPSQMLEQRLLIRAPVGALPVSLRFRDLPLTPSPLLEFLVGRLLRDAAAAIMSTPLLSSSSSQPQLVRLRTDNSTAELVFRFPIASSGGGSSSSGLLLSDDQVSDAFLTAWISVNRPAGCALCRVWHRELRRVSPSDQQQQGGSSASGLLLYQRLQFDGFVGRDTMRRLNHDDLNQLMGHRLQYILVQLFNGSDPASSNASLAGFDFECYGRNGSVVVFLLTRLLLPPVPHGNGNGNLDESRLRALVADKLVRLAADPHVLPAALAAAGADLRVLVRRSGLPVGTVDWFDAQITFEFELPPGSAVGSTEADAGLEYLRGRLRPTDLVIVQLRLLRWKLLHPPTRRLATALVTLATKRQRPWGSGQQEQQQQQQLSADLSKTLASVGIAASGPNLTLPMQQFDHEPGHRDTTDIEWLHAGLPVRQTAFMVQHLERRLRSRGPEFPNADLTSDYLCQLLAAAYRQRGGARLRLVDDSCAASAVQPDGEFRPHPLSRRLVGAVTATTHYTLYRLYSNGSSGDVAADNSTGLDLAEADDIVQQLTTSLNAFSDAPADAPTLAVGPPSRESSVPVFQSLRFVSADFPPDLLDAKSRLYRDSRAALVRVLTDCLRRAHHLFAAQVDRVAFASDGGIVALVDYRLHPRLLEPEPATRALERETEAALSGPDGSPFHGTRLDAAGSSVALQPLSIGRDPRLDAESSSAAPIAIYCILGVACALLLLLSVLLLARLLRMRRNSQRFAKFQGSGKSTACAAGAVEEGGAGAVERDSNNNRNNGICANRASAVAESAPALNVGGLPSSRIESGTVQHQQQQQQPSISASAPIPVVAIPPPPAADVSRRRSSAAVILHQQQVPVDDDDGQV